jgi:hypothetical protein
LKSSEDQKSTCPDHSRYTYGSSLYFPCWQAVLCVEFWETQPRRAVSTGFSCPWRILTVAGLGMKSPAVIVHRRIPRRLTTPAGPTEPVCPQIRSKASFKSSRLPQARKCAPNPILKHHRLARGPGHHLVNGEYCLSSPSRRSLLAECLSSIPVPRYRMSMQGNYQKYSPSVFLRALCVSAFNSPSVFTTNTG